MKDKLLSIVIPVYNIEKYLVKCVQSLGELLNNRQAEILIINDGSTDGTLDKACYLENLYFNVWVVSKHNEGLSATRNLGNKLARGEYIYFLDGDDYLTTGYIHEIVRMLNLNMYDMVCMGYSRVDINGERESVHLYNQNKDVSSLQYTDFVNSLVGDDNEPIAGFIPTKIIRHCMIDKISFRAMNYEDFPFVFDILQRSKMKIVYLNSPIFNYVQRDNSITHFPSEQNLLDKLKSLSLVSMSLNEMNVEKKTKYLNFRRTLIASLWVSALNIRGVKSAKVAHYANVQLTSLPFLLNKRVGVNLYMFLKMLMYMFRNKILCMERGREK